MWTSTSGLYPVYNSIITSLLTAIAIVVSIAPRATVQFTIDNVVITHRSFIIAVAIRIDTECTQQSWGWTTQNATMTATPVIRTTIALDAALAHIIA
jgi:hypothetical protein